MADTKISSLTAATTLGGSEKVPVVQSGSTVRTTAQDIANLGKTISAASKLLGRGSAAGGGAPVEISLGGGLTMSGTTLSAPAAGGTAAALNIDTDGTLGADSDSLIATQKATKTYVDSLATLTTPVLIQIACSDETTALTAGTAKVTFRAPYAFTLTDVRGSVTTAATGATLLTVDVNESGTTVLSTKLTFDASEKTTTTAATPRVISDTSIANDAEITIDIDSVGSTIAGAGLKVTLIGTKP